MPSDSFRTTEGNRVPAVTAAEMAAVDRVAVEDVGIDLLQLMENAGRALAWHVRQVRSTHEVLVVPGGGGNGGGGLACARHLANRDVPVQVLLDRHPEDYSGAAGRQYHILDEMDVPTLRSHDEFAAGTDCLVVDALVGYGLAGALRAPAAELLEATTARAALTVSLDVPSGVDATTGERPGIAVRPDRTVTLALPKTGLDALEGALYLADIAIPKTVYDRLDIGYRDPFGDRDWVELEW